MRVVLLILIGASVGLSLGAIIMHLIALSHTHDFRGQVGAIASKLGWVLVMLPLLRAVGSVPRVETTWIVLTFECGLIVASIGFAFQALDVNRTNRVLAAGAVHKIGLEAVETAVAEAEHSEEDPA